MLYFDTPIDNTMQAGIIEDMMTRETNMKLITEILQAILFVAITFSPLWIWLAMMKPL
jgi:hypothetical protein